LFFFDFPPATAGQKKHCRYSGNFCPATSRRAAYSPLGGLGLPASFLSAAIENSLREFSILAPIDGIDAPFELKHQDCGTPQQESGYKNSFSSILAGIAAINRSVKNAHFNFFFDCGFQNTLGEAFHFTRVWAEPKRGGGTPPPLLNSNSMFSPAKTSFIGESAFPRRASDGRLKAAKPF
jgi:hypothetical protein